MKEEYLTPIEVARELRVSTQSVSKWCRLGKLKAIRAGRSWRITRADLNEFTRRGVPQEGESPKASGLALSY